jgi:choline dehydrogenase-like flavoprotein
VSVEMGIRHRVSGEYKVVPVATSDTFRRVWLPACEQLGLELVPLFAGGALTTVPPELVPQIIAEVERLRGWARAQASGEYLADRCSDILAAFARTDPTGCEYDFG